MSESEQVREVRKRLWDLIQTSEGYAFIGDNFDDVASWNELIELCESSAYHFQVSANVCRAIARTCRKRNQQRFTESK